VPLSVARVMLQARRAVLALVCGFAFALQGYIAQTHIHIADFPMSVVSSASVLSQPTLSSQPGNPDQQQDDLSKCPFCQASASVGNVLWAVPPVLLVSLIGSVTEPIAAEFIARDAAPSYVWRSRGPPQR
jgi:hypothetical protein